jgi:nitroreductase
MNVARKFLYGGICLLFIGLCLFCCNKQNKCSFMSKGVEMRQSEVEILPLLRDRWSPRAMNGAPLSLQEIKQLVEAAKWAPSSYNNQPWRFFYALPDDAYWQKYMNLMVPFNQQWASKAGALFIVAARTLFEFNNQTSKTASYDTGAAVENFSLQGHAMGLAVHQMEGFDYEKAHALLGLSSDYQVQVMVAVGHPGKLEDIPEEMRAKESPSGRKKLDQIMFHGSMK